jgi:NADH:ubiquinone oxidoreductase subunit K
MSRSVKPINLIVASTGVLLLAALLSLVTWSFTHGDVALTLMQLFFSLAAIVAGVPLLLLVTLVLIRASIRGCRALRDAMVGR